ncbi:MAG: carbohydrate kinase [Planctomycetota bacterium]
MSEPVAPKTVVGVGELLWDISGGVRRPGGAPANVAFHAQQLGDRGLVCSRVGRDPLGDELIARLAAKTLATDAIQVDPEHPTGVVTVERARADQPSYHIREDVAWDYVEFNERLHELMSGAAAVCFGTLAQRSPETRETIRRCLAAAANAVLVYDVNLRPPWYRREWIEQSLQRCHIAKLNADEAGVLSSMLGVRLTTLPDFAAALCRRYELELVCVTRASAGCLLVSATETVDERGVSVRVVDAVGAGDAFSAGLIHSCLRRRPLASIARFANGVGALVARHVGAMPVLGAELAALKKEVW